MTQGFPPGQQAPQAYPQAAYPQQPQPQHYPGGHPQQNANANQQRTGSRGWLITLGATALVFPIYLFVTEFVTLAMDLDLDELSAFVADTILRVVLPVAGCAVMLRSVVARWVLVVASALLIVLTLVESLVDANGIYWGLLFLVLPVVVLVVAFLPPVNRAFRKAPVPGTPTTRGYGAVNPVQQGFPQPQQQPMPHQQPMPYQQQPWQQGPQR